MARRKNEIARTEALPATQARKLLADLLSRVAYRQDRFVLTRRGKPVAALVSVEDLEALEASEDQADARAALAALKDRRTVSAAQVHAEVRGESRPASSKAKRLKRRAAG